MKRPLCQERHGRYGNPCKHPAKFVVDAPIYKGLLVCGLHARAFVSTALHPFRLKDWEKLKELTNEQTD